MRFVLLSALSVALLLGCPAEDLDPTPPGQPRLLVSTEGAADGALDFGRFLVGESSLRSLTVQNVGDGVLRSLALRLPAGPPLTAAPAALPASLAPGARVVVALRWTPEQDSSLDAWVEVVSDDPLRPIFPVSLRGEAEGPLAAIEPAGRALSGGVGCEIEVELAVRHAGRAGILRVGRVGLSEEVGGLWELAVDPEGSALTVGQAVSAVVRWTPDDGRADAATVSIQHDAPGEALRASLAATPQTGPEVVDEYVQGIGAPSDLLLVVDSSPGFDRSPLSDALPALVDALDATGADWRVGVVSTDSSELGRLLGPTRWVEAGDEEPIEALRARLPEPTGAGVTQGLHAAWLALTAPANDGFRRPDGLLHLVFVSDAEDLSEPARGWTPADYLVEYELAALSSLGQLRVSAVTGGVAGCSGDDRSAAAELRYSEAVAGAEGHALSFCSDPWDSGLEEIGAMSTHSPRRLALSERAVPDHVVVTVGGEPTEAFDYLPGPNAVQFHAGSVPAVGSEVRVAYATAVCSGEPGE